MSVSLPLVLGLALSGVAHAQDTIDLGVLKNSDISVVQKMLYTKEGRTELAMHVGVMPFDAYSTTPLAMVSYGSFMSESLGWEVALGAGYGLKTADYKELEGPMYGVAPDAYRYLLSASGDVQWSPIYAKMNLGGQKILHYDVYGLAGLDLSVKDSMVLPELEVAVAPGAVLGIGGRFYLSKNSAVRVQLRDEVVVEIRSPTTGGTHLDHQLSVTAGFAMLSKED